MYNKIFKLQSELIKALAHSRRLEIINLLRDSELNVSEIYTMLDLPQANVSQHLQILRDAGVVKTKKIGKVVNYSLVDKKFIKINDLLREVIADRFIDDLSVEDINREMRNMVPLAHDLVCKMRVSPKTAGFVYDYQGKRYYFCASGCLEKFKKEPATYVK